MDDKKFNFSIFNILIPEYDGSEESINDFLARCDTFHDFLDEDGKATFLKCLVFKLGGKTLEFFQEQPRKSWPEFRKDLINAIAVKEPLTILQHKLRTCRQNNGECVAEYAGRIQSVLSKIKAKIEANYSNKEVRDILISENNSVGCRVFREGLMGELKIRLFSQHVEDNICKLIKFAIEEEAYTTGQFSNQPNPSEPNIFNSGFRINYNDYRYTRLTRSNEQSRYRNQSFVKFEPTFCSKYNRPGHRTKNCFAQATVNQNLLTFNSESRSWQESRKLPIVTIENKIPIINNGSPKYKPFQKEESALSKAQSVINTDKLQGVEATVDNLRISEVRILEHQTGEFQKNQEIWDKGNNNAEVKENDPKIFENVKIGDIIPKGRIANIEENRDVSGKEYNIATISVNHWEESKDPKLSKEEMKINEENTKCCRDVKNKKIRRRILEEKLEKIENNSGNSNELVTNSKSTVVDDAVEEVLKDRRSIENIAYEETKKVKEVKEASDTNFGGPMLEDNLYVKKSLGNRRRGKVSRIKTERPVMEKHPQEDTECKTEQDSGSAEGKSKRNSEGETNQASRIKTKRAIMKSNPPEDTECKTEQDSRSEEIESEADSEGETTQVSRNKTERPIRENNDNSQEDTEYKTEQDSGSEEKDRRCLHMRCHLKEVRSSFAECDSLIEKEPFEISVKRSNGELKLKGALNLLEKIRGALEDAIAGVFAFKRIWAKMRLIFDRGKPLHITFFIMVCPHL